MDAAGSEVTRLGFEAQQNHLLRYIQWAERVGELAGLWQPSEQQLHLRPTSSGITLVDLDLSRPQLGRGRIGGKTGVRARFIELAAVGPGKPPGRSTPEKRLQSWLLSEAYNNDRAMVSLSSDLLFVTDEVAMPGRPGMTCDLLALRTTAAGAVPVVVELKSERSMSRLLEQLDFADVIDTHHDGFERLFAAMLGQMVTFAGPCERWLLWPAAGDHKVDPRVAELADKGVRVVAYRQRGDSYELWVGSAPR